jgi:hypothetical protein
MARLRQFGSIFAYMVRRDRLFVPVLLGAELVAAALTALMALAWGPAFIAVGVPLAFVAMLIVINTRLRAVLAQDEADGVPGAPSTDRP